MDERNIYTPTELASRHHREEGSFRNPYPADSKEFDEYEEQAWRIGMDEHHNDYQEMKEWFSE